jgi:histidinol dehydrogenase
MKKILYPSKNEWPFLIKRPFIKQASLDKLITKIFNDIEKRGDAAVKKYSRLFDQSKRKNLAVTAKEIKSASATVSPALQNAIRLAKKNIETFHKAQLEQRNIITTSKGVQCWIENRAIETAGIYIPGGSAPLFSTVLMLAIPAKIAGCKKIVLCTPPSSAGDISPVILFTAALAGVTEIYAVGGIQAIAALHNGTETIPKTNKIFGPGNQFVTAAKQFAQQKGTAIDLPAGPSELLVIADDRANPAFVASDLLSQAEHGTDSQVILLSDSEKITESVLQEIKKQMTLLPRKKIIAQSLRNSKAIVLRNIASCIAFSNQYAPEHLVIACKKAKQFVPAIENAGSVFLGDYSPESAGDYASGTNHTLPTNGNARCYSGVSVSTFLKKISFQEISEEGLLRIGPSIELMAEAEKLMAHKNAVRVRLHDSNKVFRNG